MTRYLFTLKSGHMFLQAGLPVVPHLIVAAADCIIAYKIAMHIWFGVTEEDITCRQLREGESVEFPANKA